MREEEASSSPAPSFLQRYGALLCLLVSATAAYGIGKAFGMPSGITLSNTSKRFACRDAMNDGFLLGLFGTYSQWLATVVLEGVVAAFAVMVAATILFQTVGRRLLGVDLVAIAGLVLGLVAIGIDAHSCWGLRQLDASDPHGTAFLSQLLATLPVPACNSVRHAVSWARLLAEPAGILIGVAMTSLAGFFVAPGPEELGRRSRALNRLLYVASLLFVVGILMSRANFTWVLAQWDLADDKQQKALRGIITAGVTQSGVAYSALLVVFFLPVRSLLAVEISRSAPSAPNGEGKPRAQWLKKYGLSLDFQGDLKQILAILAPVISAPIFDAIAK